MQVLDMNMNISIALIFALISCIIAVLSFVRNSKKDNESDVDKQLKQKEEFTKINMKPDELCRGSQDIQVTQKTYFNELRELNKRVIVCEKDIENIYEMLDNHQSKIDNLTK